MRIPDILIFFILLVNAVISVLIVLYGLTCRKGVRCIVVTFGILSFFGPVVVPAFMGCGLLLERIFLSREVDTEDISFDKTREKATVMPDVDAEMNYVPIEDAMVLSNSEDLRRLLIDILKYDSRSSIGSIAGAMNSTDTEVSHYAASAIQDALSEFRNTSQRLTDKLYRYPQDVSANLTALEYLYAGLRLKIMSDTEQRSYVYSENAVAENLYRRNRWYMTAQHYHWMIRLMESVGDYTLADEWLERALECRPNELETYKARLFLLYAEERREEFFACIEEFKQTDIEADQEILDIIRLYS